MPNLDHEIETLRQEAAQRAITGYYKAFENLSMYDVSVFDVWQMFAQNGWEMRDLKPFRIWPVPPAEQKAHLQRLKDVVQGDAEQGLVDAAEVLWQSGLKRSDIIGKLDQAFGPNFQGGS
jgi:hypothetical protein